MISTSQFLRQEADRLGFSFVGIAKADFLEKEARQMEQWLHKGHHGQMAWMENHFDKRLDPRKLVEGAKSVVTFLYNYHNPTTQADPSAPKISQYAYGEDYHYVLKGKLKELLHKLEERLGEVNGRAFVDSAPVMERQWAERGGLGWQGKHTLLINKEKGSYFFIATLIIDIPLDYDHPIKDYCGTCTRCIDACPTEAISPQGYLLDASKCISYLTIELRGEISSEFEGKMEGWAFGCDICQQVCPWNRFATPHQEPAFSPSEELMSMQKGEWLELTEEVFQRLFKKSPVKRTKLEGMRRNIKFLK